MKSLEDIANGIELRLEEKDQVREVAIKSSRAIIRLSGTIVHAIHKGEDVKPMLHEALDETHRLKSLLDDYPDIWESGLVGDALQEVSEATILFYLVTDDTFPDPDELGIPGNAYIMGLADAVGELRRFSLEKLREGKIEEAEKYLDLMRKIFLVIMRFDFPDALVPIRRKQDVARSLLEKTRGDVALAASTAKLQSRMDDLIKKL